jgi:NUMOD4 motif-containing protein
MINIMDNTFWNEEWKKLKLDDVILPTKYEISNLGRVRRKKKKSDEIEVVNPTNIKGYSAFIFRSTENKPCTKYVHKMVGEAFIKKERKDQSFVIHIDFDKQNNKVDNLKWVDKWELASHHRHNPKARKRKITNAKLDETKVKLIKKILQRDNKTRLKMIAKRFGISHTQLNRIRSGENWGHVTVDD